jgi:cyclic pyranopterin phosphate synthase
MEKEDLTHLDSAGRARMVDVGGKPESNRWAVARGSVAMSAETFARLEAGDIRKGDVRATAELAGVMAAKRTAELIPLCHPLPLTHVEVEVTLEESLPGVEIRAKVSTTSRTGVEMEALTAVSVAALTVYDMIKGIEKGAKVREIRLVEKHGGRSGDVVLEDV